MHVFIALCLLALQPTSLWGRSVGHRAHEVHGAWGSSSESLEASGASPRDNIAELLLPLIEQGLSAEHSPKHSKKVIQVLPISKSQEHSASWPNLNTRRKHVVEITPLRGKGRDGQPLAYILSPAKPNRRSRKRGNNHHDSYEQKGHGNHQEKPSKDFDVNTVPKEVLDSSETSSESISSERVLVEPSQERSESISHERDGVNSSEERSESLSHEDQSVQASAERNESISEEDVNPSEERIDSTYHEEEIVQNSEETESFSQENVVLEPSEGNSENISHEQVVVQPLKERIESIIHEGVIVQPSDDPKSTEINVVESSEDESASNSYEKSVVPSFEAHKESIMVLPEEHRESFSQVVTEELLKEHNKLISSRQQSIEEDPGVVLRDKPQNTVVEPIGDEYKIHFGRPVIDDDNIDQNKEVVIERLEEHSKSINESEEVVKEASVDSSDTVENTAIESIGEEYNHDVSDQDISIRRLVTFENAESSDSDVIEKIFSGETIPSKNSSEPFEESHIENISNNQSNPNKNNESKALFDSRSDSNNKSKDTIIERPHGDDEYSIRIGHHNNKGRHQPVDLNSKHSETNHKHDYTNQYVEYSKHSLAATQLESSDVVNHHNEQSETSGLLQDTNHSVHKVQRGNHVISSAELKVSKNLDESAIQTHANHEEYGHIHHNPEKLSQRNIIADKGHVELSTIPNASYFRNVESDGGHSEKQEHVRKIGHHDGNGKIHKHPHNRKENQSDNKNADNIKNHLAVKSTDNIQMPMVEITVSQSENQQKLHSENTEDPNLVQSDLVQNVHTKVAEVKQPASSSETERNVVISQRGVLNNVWDPHSTDFIKLIQSSGERSDSDADHAPCHAEHQDSNAHIHEHKSYRLSFLFNRK